MIKAAPTSAKANQLGAGADEDAAGAWKHLRRHPAPERGGGRVCDLEARRQERKAETGPAIASPER